MISCEEIDMVIILEDNAHNRGNEPDYQSILRLCNMYLVPVATNIASAELFIHGLGRGDLDWRDVARNDRFNAAVG